MKASSARAGAVGFVVLSAVTASVFLACSSDDSGGLQKSPDGSVAPEPLFRALQSDLVASCGGPNGSCHVSGSYLGAPPWLANPDPYASAKKYRGVIPATNDVSDSILLTQTGHEGPSLKSQPNDLYGRVLDWVQAEIQGPILPNSGAFPVVDGANSISLQQVLGLQNAKLTFVATISGNVLVLNGIKLQAPSDANVKITSPFFVVLPKTGKVVADPAVNGFSGELTVPAGESRDLFTGTMNLLHWDSAGQLKIVFASAETTPGTAVTGDCTALGVFQDKAITAMTAQVTVVDPQEGDGGMGAGEGGVEIGKGSCLGCHGDTAETPKYPEAVNAMDLRPYNANPSDPAAACKHARVWINLKDKPNSTILANPLGTANPKHPVKPLAPNDPIILNLTEWVNAEQ